MRLVRRCLLIIALLTMSVLPLTASTVTFDPFPFNDSRILSGTVTIEGFDFTSAHFHIVGVPNPCCVSDGTKYLGVDGFALGFPVTMTEHGGGTFSVLGLDAAKLFLQVGGNGPGFPNAVTLDLLGNVLGGGTVNTSLLLPPEGSFSTFTVSGFSNLTSLVISGSVPGVTDDASWAVDNIAVSTVPEPGTLVLLVTGILSLAGGLRRRLL